MNKSNEPSENSNKIETNGGVIKETDNMGREKFWEDIGRPND